VKCYLVRHGEIESNLRKIYAGRNDELLTLRGRQQAEATALKIKDLGIEAIYSSPLPRAVETAEIVGKYIGKIPVIEDSFNELALGPWESKSEVEIKRDFPNEWAIWNTRPADLFLEGRETLGELLQRVLIGLEKIKNKNNGKIVAIVTHVAVIRVLLIKAHNFEFNLYKTLDVPNAKIFLLPGF
jgi:broad specificity phosphatase PhoE